MVRTIDILKPYDGSINVIDFTDTLFPLSIKPNKNDSVYYFKDFFTVEKAKGRIYLPKFDLAIDLGRHINSRRVDETLNYEISKKLFNQSQDLIDKLVKNECKYIYQIIFEHPSILPNETGLNIVNNSVAYMRVGLFGTKTLHVIRNIIPTKYSKIQIYGFKK